MYAAWVLNLDEQAGCPAAARGAEAGDGDAYDSPQRHWDRALQEQVSPMPAAEAALNMILIAEGICRSAELGREVRAEEMGEV